MKAKYEDILDEITGLVRQLHEEHAGEYSSYPDGCMGNYARGVPCACVAKPLWFDENGVPRFREHQPSLAPSIYAYEVALLEIECQSCGERFLVQMDHDSFNDMRAHNRWTEANEKGIPLGGDYKEFIASARLSGRVKSGFIHYGDPPRHDYHDGGRCAGETMNCIDLRVVEFWRSDKSTGDEWKRVPELEVTFPKEDEDAVPSG